MFLLFVFELERGHKIAWLYFKLLLFTLRLFLHHQAIWHVAIKSSFFTSNYYFDTGATSMHMIGWMNIHEMAKIDINSIRAQRKKYTKKAAIPEQTK